MSIYLRWMEAKEAERLAVDTRRELEDQLVRELHIDQVEGSKTLKVGEFQVKVTQRFNRTIDSDFLQEIASEYGLLDYLPTLFRWKPEINAKAWKDAGDNITAPLSKAITTKPGRPSFAINLLNEE